MEAHPDAGIIQDRARAPAATRRCMRASSNSARAPTGRCSPAGMHFWQLGESHYWGHNAILRMAPFIEHCALAKLPGKTSLSGGRDVARFSSRPL